MRLRMWQADNLSFTESLRQQLELRSFVPWQVSLVNFGVSRPTAEYRNDALTNANVVEGFNQLCADENNNCWFSCLNQGQKAIRLANQGFLIDDFVTADASGLSIEPVALEE